MNNTGWHGFIKLCKTVEDEKTLATLFDFFLTREEKDSIATRYLIVKDLLANEKTQRHIAQELHVSIAKITRGSNELKRVTPKLRHYLREKL